MCKVNGHSVFTWLVNPYNMIKSDMERRADKRAKKAIAEYDALQAEKAAKEAKSQTIQDTAASLDNTKNEKTPITALRVPLNTQGTGTNTGNKQVGLNLTGG